MDSFENSIDPDRNAASDMLIDRDNPFLAAVEKLSNVCWHHVLLRIPHRASGYPDVWIKEEIACVVQYALGILVPTTSNAYFVLNYLVQFNFEQTGVEVEVLLFPIIKVAHLRIAGEVRQQSCLLKRLKQRPFQ